MKATEAIYNIKKCIKQFKSDKIDKNVVVTGLLMVRKYLYEIDRKQLGNELKMISRSLVCESIDTFMAVSRLGAVIEELKKIQEKNSVMNQRRCHAEIKFNNKELRKRKHNWNLFMVDSLSRYDVIMVPSQGGFHLCIVSDVIDGDRVIAFPMTTGDELDLKSLGCRIYPLKDVECSHNCTILTSAATIVPFNEATKCFVESMPYSLELEKALSYVEKAV